jgi:PPOX class probable F420-dependent enzyme
MRPRAVRLWPGRLADPSIGTSPQEIVVVVHAPPPPSSPSRSGRVEEACPIPASHLDLAECPPVAALTTIDPAGYPQTSVVWCDFDGACVRVNTMRGFAKERNMRRDPRVTLLCYDPGRPLRSLEIRGLVVEMTEIGAHRHLDQLASKYAGRRIHYFGEAIPAHFAETEIPILCRIRPMHVVVLDAAGTPSGS